MSEDPTFPTQTLMLFAEDSLASHSVTRDGSPRLKTTPVTSGQRCLGLSGNAGPLGLLEKTLLESSTWAWTKYSLTWRAKATPQGRLIFQLARLAPRTSGSGFGLLHTPTAKANQMAPSMATRDSGSWGLGLWPTPNAREKGGGEYQDPEKIKARMEKGHQANLGDMVKLDQKSGGKLSPLWVAWLMGYPTEYLNSVPWETPSSRKSQKKSETQ